MTALLLALAGAALAGSTGASAGAETGSCKATQGEARGVPAEWQLQVELPPGTSAITAAGEGGEVVLVSKAGEVPCGVTADAIRGGTVTGTASDDNVIFDNSSGGGPLKGAFEVVLRAGNNALTIVGTKGDDTAVAGGPPPGDPATKFTIDLTTERELEFFGPHRPGKIVFLFLDGLDLFGLREPRSDSGSAIAVPLSLSGGGGADRLTGGLADDTVLGGGGGDRLAGGKGKDLLDGGGGEDRCRGGPGKDREKRCE